MSRRDDDWIGRAELVVVTVAVLTVWVCAVAAIVLTLAGMACPQ